MAVNNYANLIITRRSYVGYWPRYEVARPNTPSDFQFVAVAAKKATPKPKNIIDPVVIAETQTAPIVQPEVVRLNAAATRQTLERKKKKIKITTVSSGLKFVWGHRFYAAGTAVFVFSALVATQTLLANMQTKKQVTIALGAVTQTTEPAEDNNDAAESNVPSTGSPKLVEKPPTKAAHVAYTVAPDMPRYIRIAGIGVNARVKNVGIDSKGAVDVPINIHDTGWYNGSNKPSEKSGASLIVGHASGLTTPAVFANLKKVKIGSEVVVENGDGSAVKYKVIASRTIPKDSIDMAQYLTAPQGKKILNLISCTGKFIQNEQTFSDRLVLTAEAI